MHKSSAEYQNLTEKMCIKFPQEELNDRYVMIAKKDSKRVNFDKLRKLLTTKINDAAEYKGKVDWLFDGYTKFLDESISMQLNRVVYASFPRSGNSFVRKIFESITGVATGSDVNLNNYFNIALQ